MPRTVRRTTQRTSARRKRIRGGSAFMKFLKNANNWLRKTSAISKGAKFLADNTKLPGMSQVASAAKSLGYGRRRRGGALRLAGGRRGRGFHY